MTCHALKRGLQKEYLPGWVRKSGPNRGPIKALIPQEGCRKVLGILRKLADRRKRGLWPLFAGPLLSVSPLLSEPKEGGPTGI